MSKKIKDHPEDSLNKQMQKRLNQTLAERNVAISFEHEIPNANYNPAGIRDKNDRLDFYEKFREKLKIVNSKTWKDFGKEPKVSGYETIPYKELKEALKTSLKNVNIVSPDSKLDVIRVTNKYRVIGKYLAGVYYCL